MSAERAAPGIHTTIANVIPFSSDWRTQILEKVIIMTKPTSPGDTPFRINLEQQKKRAKEFLKALRNHEPSALARFKKHLPEKTQNQSLFKLSDSQCIIARELGLPSWPKLKSHVESMQQASDAIKKQAMTNDSNAPDAEFKTLHIRCGSDLASTLPAAGFKGDFLEYSDPYGQGPIIQDDNFFQTRAKFLYESYGRFMELNQNDTQSSLEKADDKLKHANNQYERIVLWFEHDSYDQLILARLLAFFAKTASSNKDILAKLEMVTLNHFPGSVRFIGLGQLPPEAIRLIWQQRKSVTQDQLTLGKKIWSALGSASPLPLYELFQSKTISHLPHMKAALLRHFQELPSTTNGLSLTEQITLEVLNEGSATGGQLFGQLMRKRDPLPWLGDIMYWHILHEMTQASHKVFTQEEYDLNKPWPKKLFTITDAGKNIISNQQNWLSLNPPERWWGGLNIIAGQPCWCWDHQKNQPTFT